MTRPPPDDTQVDLLGLLDALNTAFPAPHNTVDTSVEAADSVTPLGGALRKRIYAALVASGGMTCDEVEEVFHLRHQTASARLNELEYECKLVVKAEKRKTRSGRQARVYRPVAP